MQVIEVGIKGTTLIHMAPMSETKLPPITGPYFEFAELVRETTGKVPRHQAAYRANVSHNTIARMWQGKRTTVDKILDFAKGYGISPNPLLKAQNYDELPEAIADAIAGREEECIRFLAPPGYADLAPEIRKHAEAAAVRAFKDAYANVADALMNVRAGHNTRKPESLPVLSGQVNPDIYPGLGIDGVDVPVSIDSAPPKKSK